MQRKPIATADNESVTRPRGAMGPLEFQGETVSFRFAEALARASAVMGSGVPEREAGGVLEKKCARCAYV